MAVQWYALTYLPLVDCLPFKKGNNIAEQMKPPPGAVQDSFAIRFIYEKNGKRFDFAPESLPADFTTYKFIDRKQTLVRKGNAEPRIKGFALTGASGEDSTTIVLEEPVALILYCLDFNNNAWFSDFKEVLAAAKQKGIPVHVASPSLQEGVKAFAEKGINEVQQFNLDFTVVRTVARTNPTLVLLQKGTILKKYSAGNIHKAISDISALIPNK